MIERLKLALSNVEQVEAPWRLLERRELLIEPEQTSQSAFWPLALGLLDPDLAIEVRQSIGASHGRVETELALVARGAQSGVPDSTLLLRVVAGMIEPSAVMGAMRASTTATQPQRIIRPYGREFFGGCDRSVELQTMADRLGVQFSPATIWPWQLGRALAVLGSCGGGAITVRVSRLSGTERPTCGLDALNRILFAARDKGLKLAGLDRVVEWAQTLRYADQLMKLDVFLEGESVTTLTYDFVSLALFGSRADPSDDITDHDLRGLIAMGAAPPRLFANSDTRILSSTSSSLGAGDVEIGTTPDGEAVVLQGESRMRHTYVIGATGTGKSTLLQRLIAQDVAAGDTVVLLDPHGDLSLEVAEGVKSISGARVHFADAADPNGSYVLDLLQPVRNEQTREQAFDNFMAAFRTVLYDNKDAFGPNFEQFFRNALFLLALGGADGETIADLPRIFTDPALRKSLLLQANDRDLDHFWLKVAARISGEQSLENFTPYITSKLTRLIGSPLAKRLFSKPGAGIDFAREIQPGRVLLLRLPKGELGSGTTELAATMTLRLLADAIMSRPLGSRTPVRLYVDEVQSFNGETLAMLLAEGRKFGASLTLANQSLAQIGSNSSASLAKSVLANVANLLIFRVGAPDAIVLSPWLEEPERWRDLCGLPDFHLRARLVEAGCPIQVPLVRTSCNRSNI